jgi:LEA14-like dessication related protein
MKTKIKRISIFVLALLLISAEVIFIFHDRIKAHFIPEVKQMGEITINVKNDTAFISSKLTIRNKSFLKIKADTIKYNVSLLDKTYLKNKKFIGVILPGNGADTINFSLKVPYIAIIKDLKAQRKSGDSSSYTITVGLKCSTVLGSSEIAINKTAKFKLPQPPELEVVEIKYKKVRLKYILAEAKIKVTNYNPVALSINNMNYNMMVSEKGNIKGIYPGVINIKPNGETFVSLPIEIDVNKAGKILMDVIKHETQYNYTLTLSAIIESTNPVKESFHIDITKTGRMDLRK